MLNSSSESMDGEVITEDHVAKDLLLAEIVPSQRAAFSIDNEEKANWLVRKIVQLRGYRERVRHWAEQETSRAESEERQLLFLFESQLRRWTNEQIERRGARRKSVNLPAGSVGFRHEPCKLVIEDETVVMEWAKAHQPDAVVVTSKLLRSVIASTFKESGVIPEAGVRIEPPIEKFYIR